MHTYSLLNCVSHNVPYVKLTLFQNIHLANIRQTFACILCGDSTRFAKYWMTFLCQKTSAHVLGFVYLQFTDCSIFHLAIVFTVQVSIAHIISRAALLDLSHRDFCH